MFPIRGGRVLSVCVCVCCLVCWLAGWLIFFSDTLSLPGMRMSFGESRQSIVAAAIAAAIAAAVTFLLLEDRRRGDVYLRAGT